MAIGAALLVSFAEGIASQLGSLSLTHLGPFFCGKGDLQALADTVSTVKAVLLDEEKQQGQSNAIGLWLENLIDAIYDADELLDDLSTKAELREANEVCVYLFFSKLADCVEMGPQIQPILRHANKVCASVCLFFPKLADGVADSIVMCPKIKALRKRLDAIADDRQKFHLKEHPHVDTRVRNREIDTLSYEPKEEVIGRDHDRKSVIELLMDSNITEDVSILAIVGVGGLGKTTLAKHIFNDEKIKDSFEVKMWVCVSENFEFQKIVETMLELATQEKPKTTLLDTLVYNLKKAIDGKKYFLVLDDLWNEDSEEWMNLKKLLVGGARGSIILVTTRSERVARVVRAAKQYPLRSLDEDASWCLFKQMAFEKGEEPENSIIVAIGKEILEKCAGVPLAIRTIGKQLYLENSETEWLSFKTDAFLRIKQNEILPTLKLSYDKLPSHLKTCFASAVCFPRITVFVNQFLLNFGWHKASSIYQSKTTASKMSEMCTFWNYFGGSFMTTLDYKKKAIDVKTRHLSVDDRKSLCVVPNFKLGRMRTIIFPFASTLYVPRHDSNLWTNYLSTWDSLKFLRALDVSYGRFLGLECSIGDLKQLRYLDLSHNNSIKKLPDSITRLQNLQTLRLNGCAELQELHKDMKKLVNLRHVENEKCGSLTHMPRGMGEMTNLQTLSTFVVSFRGSISVDSGGLNELKGLNNLRGNLVIEGLRHGKDAELEYKAADLKEKQYLQSLNLSWWHINRTEVVREEMLWEGLQPHPNLKKLTLKLYPDVRFPNWLLLLTNLVGLELEDCRNLQYLPQLSQLPSLESFSLFKLYNLEYIQSDNGDSNMFSASSSTTPLAFFPSLKKIHLTDCPRLKGWSRRTVTSMMEQPLIPSFPRLSFFKVKDCPMLSSTPMFPHLEEKLELDGASWKPVQQTMMAYVAAPQCPSTVIASSFNPLSKLKRLELISIADLQSFPEEGLQNLIGLQYLSIRFCDRLQSLSRGIQHLTALQESFPQGKNPPLLGGRLHSLPRQTPHCTLFQIAMTCKAMMGMGCNGKAGLRRLGFLDLPKLKSLPLGLQHLTTLRELYIARLEFTALPEWIHNWASLEVLSIINCPSLASLPEGMRGLTSLQKLTVNYCYILSPRCKRETGEDWPKISHIPRRNDEDVEEEKEEIGEDIEEGRIDGDNERAGYKIAHVPRCNRPIFEVGAIGGYSSFLQGFRILVKIMGK
ncbi:putative disease resistance protein RGA3 [Morella rubra]|uniref:Putative disease resistance protein RGA3 n=1 Tax=Morella rubra TaxID=262757 RepID=A0A6A1WQ60_9ROSI|nr:putative disease resistance protein RGA3 [Morella rubra]